MRFSLRRAAAIVGCMGIAAFCSCERHRVEELPPAASAERGPSAPDATPAPRHTPANFFPPTTKP